MKTEQDRFWWAAIRQAEESGTFTPREKRLAGCWPTCACGRQDKRIPRGGDGCPIDRYLRRLGAMFFSAVLADNTESARTHLFSIECRAGEIIRTI